MSPVVAALAPVIILGVPVYLVSKYFERIMHPRKSFRAFIYWLFAVLGVSMAWYFICMFTFFKFFSLQA